MIKNLATEERLAKLVQLNYPNAAASAYAGAYRGGWTAAKYGKGRDVCPYSNEYQPELDCYDRAFYVRLYIDWHYGYDAYLFWSTPPSSRLNRKQP